MTLNTIRITHFDFIFTNDSRVNDFILTEFLIFLSTTAISSFESIIFELTLEEQGFICLVFTHEKLDLRSFTILTFGYSLNSFQT
jgi:hypothetical protein